MPSASVLFVSKASVTNGAIKSYNLSKRVEIVKDTRKVSKHDMKFNGSTPIMKIDPETFVSVHAESWAYPLANDVPNQEVEADGVACKAEPSSWLALAQQHFIF